MKKKHYDKLFEYDDDKYDNGYHDELVERRRKKKIKNAIKCKDINQIIDLNDEGIYY